MTEVTLEYINERLNQLTDTLRFSMATVYATQERVDAEIAQLELKKSEIVYIQGTINELTIVKHRLETTEKNLGDE